MLEEKKCSRCKLMKKVSEFYKDERKGCRLYASCKPCHIKFNELKRNKTPKYRLDHAMATAIYSALRGEKVGESWETFVGYSLADLVKHLEKQFDKKMSWENYGSYWWIDHKVPKSWFNYLKREDVEFKKCWALNNLQPLEKISNIKKSNKFS